MIVLNYPNNPTGKILPYNTYKMKIIEISKTKMTCMFLSDEIYGQYTICKDKMEKACLSYTL